MISSSDLCTSQNISSSDKTATKNAKANQKYLKNKNLQHAKTLKAIDVPLLVENVDTHQVMKNYLENNKSREEDISEHRDTIYSINHRQSSFNQAGFISNLDMTKG